MKLYYTLFEEVCGSKRTVLMARARWGGFGPRVHVPIWFTPVQGVHWVHKAKAPCPARQKNKNTFLHGDIVPGILKKSFLFRNPYDALETRLLALSTNIAVDSPKHRKGCKKKRWISGCLEPYRFCFLEFATLTRFWRGASGHENSLFECSDNYNSRFWRGAPGPENSLLECFP